MARIVELRDGGMAWDAMVRRFRKQRLHRRSGHSWTEYSLKKAYAAELKLREEAKVRAGPPLIHCYLCGEHKPATAHNFHLNRNRPPGFHRECRECRNHQEREARRKRREARW
jgi:hypothetical protein